MYSRQESRASEHDPESAARRDDDGELVRQSSSSLLIPPGGEALSPSSASYSTSVGQKVPMRSFYHRSYRQSLDAGHYSSEGVRERTAELANLAVSGGGSANSLNTDLRPRESTTTYETAQSHDNDDYDQPERPLPRSRSSQSPSSASALTAMLRNSPPEDSQEIASNGAARGRANGEHHRSSGAINEPTPTENERLIPRYSQGTHNVGYGSLAPDIERQPERLEEDTPKRKRLTFGLPPILRDVDPRAFNPKTWTRESIWEQGVKRPVNLLPSVFLGLLLNILDALSYGMIIFPLGSPVFKQMGADGISMFYVSCVIAQLVMSCGSIFKGGIGSEMVEVVPFFHKMAYMIVDRMGDEHPEAVFATTILSFAMSSVLTGVVFFLMGVFGLGTLIGFFPRHILIGCIGGVGWFLVATGIEVAGRLSGNLHYDLDMLHTLMQPHTFVLWTTPLALAVVLLVTQRYSSSNFLVGGFFILVTSFFYAIKLITGVSMENLRSAGWVFDAVPSDNPWYHFYTLYNFSIVDWKALLATVPTMFALTFFGILHVPINVPALGISTGEDNLNVDQELIAHGVSNTLSGLFGSIQNYLVYTNSLLFIASGGNDRLAGIMLACATTCVLFIGPVIIGYIPIMVVGALIYMLGIELMEEALVDTWGKLHKLEYATVVVIIVTMGAFDFVQGIVAGIILACVSFVVQTSRKSAITATYTGEVASSTVRRHPMHVRFLREAGRQTSIVKLTGFLFFGTIVDVESCIRGLIDEKAFSERPIRYLVLDFWRVNGLDFSAAEAFTRLHRILSKRGVHMIICGLDLENDVGTSLQNVGLFSGPGQVKLFENLNSALEFCENELLKALHNRRGSTKGTDPAFSPILDVPRATATPGVPVLSEGMFNSPRDLQLHQVAQETLQEEEGAHPSVPERYSTFPQPLALLLQTFQGLTKENEDFWWNAVPYFHRATFSMNAVLFRQKDLPEGFYLLESGMLRAEYETPQGKYDELIVAGRCCGELPFFGETPRSATMRAECDCVVWVLDRKNWDELRAKEPMIAQELLRVCLKLTSERMESITSYVLTTT